MNAAANERPAKADPHYFLYRALEPLRPFLDDPNVVEIAVNRPGEVYVERLGLERMQHYRIDELSAGELHNIAERVAAITAQFVSPAKPILSAWLPGGERIQCVIPPAAPDGGALSIRKQVVSDFSLEDLRAAGAMDKVAVSRSQTGDLDRLLREHLAADRIYDFVTLALAQRVSMLISGGTSSGKTTFLNACLKSVGLDERVITLEDTRELYPPQPNSLHLVASKGDQGTSDVTIQSLMETSLRMRPDRLFVGEIRGAEAFSFLRAINTGHPGSISTVHADTAHGAYEQLIMMVQQGGMATGFTKSDLLTYVQTVIPIVIQLRREGGRRGVSEIFFARSDQ
ncbi:type IV secretion system protein VirB11 [Rhizobium sp. NFR07]|uniref:P-type DNA transfer ATPase VirB11 n=1 Tax=Rhizobium sp. NFR07 TaxID=1566262 RepID=UPI0008EFEE72|nr:P-type DNA transfer ATPase VirB11 [Rhizobium sp. NFR07]SFB63101.1 type IV secretion system protein VirB11 [Rhizobium sp. NFR07]